MALEYEHMDKQTIIDILVKRDKRIRKLGEQLDTANIIKRRAKDTTKDTSAITKRYIELEKQQDRAIEWIYTLDKQLAQIEGRESRTPMQILDTLLHSMSNNR